jgi:hypothetical protein
MSRPLHPRHARAIGLALCVACFASNQAAEPAPATMIVSLVVQQSCLVTEADDANAPAVNCLHGEPYLISQADAPSRFMSAVQYDSRRATRALWTVTF